MADNNWGGMEMEKETDQTERVVSWHLFDTLYHEFLNFVRDVEFMTKAVADINDGDNRADFILRRMIDSVDKDMDALWERAGCEQLCIQQQDTTEV
jgi:hypothetical protein